MKFHDNLRSRRGIERLPGLSRIRHRLRGLSLVLLTFVSSGSVVATADEETTLLLNYDIIVTASDNGGSIQQTAVPFSPGEPFHGTDLGKTDYFFTVSSLEGDQGTLTFEIYRFATRAKQSAPLSEYLTEIDFTLGAPTRLEATTDEFSVDLAFSISRRN